MRQVELEITPEPSADERAAIAAALSELYRDQPDSANPWWEAGVREAVDEDEPVNFRLLV